MKAATAVVHIGFEKAGSTTIQHFLGMNYAALRRAGWLYPVAAGRPLQANLPAAVMDDGRVERMRARLGLTDEQAIAGFRERLHEALAAEVEAARPTALIFSHENLSSRLQPGEIERLRDFLGGFAERVRILAYVRRQDELPTSLYSTAVLGGRTEPFVYPGVDDKVPSWFEYHRTLEPWREIFGQDAVTVRRFGAAYFEGGDLLEDLTRTLALPEGLERTERVNASFGLKQLEFVRLMNIAYEGRPDGPTRELARRLHDARESPGLGASRRSRRRFAARFEQCNRALASEYLGLDGPLFTHPFPHDPPPRREWLSAQDAVRIALELQEKSPPSQAPKEPTPPSS